MVLVLAVFKLQLVVLSLHAGKINSKFGGIVTLSGDPIRTAVPCLLLISSAALAQPTDETKPDTPRSTFADPWRKQSIIETITGLAAEFETLDD